MDRPFFNHKVEELQREFADRLDDLQFLELLAHELTFRSTAVARKLQRETLARIAALKNRAGSIPVATSRETAAAASREVAPIPAARPEKWPRNLLGAWLALEVLSPQTFRRVEDLVEGDSRRVIDLSRRPFPWEQGERSRENNRLYYQVLLGCIRMDDATGALLQRYADASPEFRNQSGFCPIAVVVLDQQGRPVEDRPVSVASFAWAWRIAMEGGLADLSQWSSVEQKLCQEIAEQLTRKGENDEILPLDSATIRNAFDFICLKLRLDPSVVVEPRHAVRTYQWFTIKSSPEPIILNSFFLEDLAWVKQQGDKDNYSAPVRQFLHRAEKNPR